MIMLRGLINVEGDDDEDYNVEDVVEDEKEEKDVEKKANDDVQDENVEGEDERI